MLAEKFGCANPAEMLERMSPGLRTYWLAYIGIMAKERKQAASGDEELTGEEALMALSDMGARIDGR